MTDVAKYKCMMRQSNFIVDSTLRNYKVAKKDMIEKKQRGYRTLLLFVDSPVDICRRRVLERQARTGRPVQAAFVDACNQQSRACAESLTSGNKYVDLGLRFT